MCGKLNDIARGVIARVQLRREEGQGLVEYALIIALVAIVVIGALSFLSTSIGSELSDVANAL